MAGGGGGTRGRRATAATHSRDGSRGTALDGGRDEGPHA